MIMKMVIKGLLLVLLVTVCVKAHEENTDMLNVLAEDLEEIKGGQEDIELAFETLKANLNELVSSKTGSAEDIARKSAKYDKRLRDLEENVKYIKSYIDAEKRLDDSLVDLTTKKLKEVDEQVAKTRQLTENAKNEADISLGGAEEILQSVKNTADNRNFNLGGAIFYGGHGSACVPGADECQLLRSECREGQCQCEPGLSYDRKTQTCIERCESYGLDFEVVSNRVIRGNNSAVFEDISLQECRQKCIDSEEFQCVTFEYFTWYKVCYLSEITMLEAEENWEYNGAGSHFQRNCN